MQSATYEHWWPLHLRVVCGEQLSAEDRAAYEAGCEQFDTDERLATSMLAKEARDQLAELQASHAKLENQRKVLDIEIEVLESKLSSGAAEALGTKD